MTIALEAIRRLQLKRSLQTGRPPFIAAASGLIRLDDFWYVIADDENFLTRFLASDSLEFGEACPILSTTLPVNDKDRKKVKPDFESLVVFSKPDSGRARATVLAMPSGSSPNRRTGLLIDVYSESGAEFRAKVLENIDFTPVFSELEKAIPHLNIEGVTVHEEHFGGASKDLSLLKLYHRANGGVGSNAVIEIGLGALRAAIQGGSPLSANLIQEIYTVDLGETNDVPYTFTDATVDENGKSWFLAAAENSTSTFDDGAYGGAILGCLNQEGRKLTATTFALNCPQKPEGLWIESSGGRSLFYVVTDADDPKQAATMYRGLLPKI